MDWPWVGPLLDLVGLGPGALQAARLWEHTSLCVHTPNLTFLHGLFLSFLFLFDLNQLFFFLISFFNFNPTLPDMKLIPLTRGWWGQGLRLEEATGSLAGRG